MSKQWGHGFHSGHKSGEKIGELIGAGKEERARADVEFKLQALIHGALSFLNRMDVSDFAARQSSICPVPDD